jgi:hypothetical protein
MQSSFYGFERDSRHSQERCLDPFLT